MSGCYGRALAYSQVNDGDHSRLKLRNQRRVAGGDSVLSVLPGKHDLVDLLEVVDRLMRRDQVERHRRLGGGGGGLSQRDSASGVKSSRDVSESGEHGTTQRTKLGMIG